MTMQYGNIIRLIGAVDNRVLRTPMLILKTAYKYGNNPGAVYINDSQTSEYLGKIIKDGSLFLRHEVRTDEQRRIEILDMLATIELNPLETAIAYSRETGKCACCNRELTNAESIAAGIGPICRDKWGF